VVPIVYNGINFGEELRLDVLAEEMVICELKAVNTIYPVFTAGPLTQLWLTRKRFGFLINLDMLLIK
jgi:GxxExxY protein